MKISRNQNAVYWPPTGPDGFGGSTYGTAVDIAVRWESRQEIYVDKDAREARSLAVVYPDRELMTEGLMYLGTLADLASGQEADPFSITGIQEIKSAQSSPSVNGREFLYKVWL